MNIWADSYGVSTADSLFSRHEAYALKDFVLILKTHEFNRWKHRGVIFCRDQIYNHSMYLRLMSLYYYLIVMFQINICAGIMFLLELWERMGIPDKIFYFSICSVFPNASKNMTHIFLRGKSSFYSSQEWIAHNTHFPISKLRGPCVNWLTHNTYHIPETLWQEFSRILLDMFPLFPQPITVRFIPVMQM